MAKKLNDATTVPQKTLGDNIPDIPGRELLKRIGVPKGLRKILLFWQVSAVGWLIDVVGLMLLLEMGVPVFFAACLSILPAFLWTFVFSTYKIYFRKKGFSPRRFGYYVAYNGVMMLLLSSAVSWGVSAGWKPVSMKLALTPVTFLANYFFVRILLKEKKPKVASRN